MIWEWRPERVRSGNARVILGRSPQFGVRCSWESFEDPREKFE
jgi:hypothetical protein